VSASRSNCAADFIPGPHDATPTLADTTTSLPETKIGSANAVRMRMPRATSEPSVACGCRTTISSPPNRLAVSSDPIQPLMRRAISDSTSSPLPWPSESFTSLKLSRSTNNTAILEPSAASRASSSSSRSSSNLRVGSPVSGSCAAVCINCAITLRRRSTSELVRAIRAASPSAPGRDSAAAAPRRTDVFRRSPDIGPAPHATSRTRNGRQHGVCERLPKDNSRGAPRTFQEDG
jgi:hypothetical protein